MSFKKSKLDLLVRVRYSNPLPAPPCPPKLINIPTDPKRYARPELLNSLANEAPLPMIVDADCGMPLDLSQWPCLWEEAGDDSELNPDPNLHPKLDPEDEFLAYDVPGTATSAHTSGSVPPTPGNSTPLANVPWLRKTEYTSKSESRASIVETKNQPTVVVDTSPAAQIRDIEATFAATNENFSLEAMRHPTNPKLTAVDSYEFLPDVDVWATTYDLFRFAERPGEKYNTEHEDLRLDSAIFRPMKSEMDDSFCSYYLPVDDASALQFKELRGSVQPYELASDQPVMRLKFVRDYEPFNLDTDIKEYVVVLDDGPPSDDADDVFGTDDTKRKGKGAFYKDIEKRMTLRKKRANASERYADKWDYIQLEHRELYSTEETFRDDKLAFVTDPDSIPVEYDAEADEIPVEDQIANGEEMEVET